MDKEIYAILLEQIKWCEKEDRLLQAIENKLLEMKAIAQFAQSNQLSENELDELNAELDRLSKEINNLEKQRLSVAH